MNSFEIEQGFRFLIIDMQINFDLFNFSFKARQNKINIKIDLCIYFVQFA